MEREAFLVIVSAALFGVVVWLSALLLDRNGILARPTEQLVWWRLTLPLIGGGVVLAFCVGWALQEPDPADEYAGVTLYLLAAFTLVVALRALVRSAKALRSSAIDQLPIGTVGLLKPRVLVSDEFRCRVSGRVLTAALSHEMAHVRRRDPLRIWIAQLAADLQWPAPGTARRFSAWLLALEAERDSEAMADGAGPEDLAEAILVAARLQSRVVARARASVAGAGEGIAWRVRRLLSAEVINDRSGPRRTLRMVRALRALMAFLVIGALWLGFTYGDPILGVLPGIGP